MTSKLHNYLYKEKQLFWDVKQSFFDKLSNEAILERVISLGDIPEYKELEKIIGIVAVKESFEKITNKKRKNISAKTENLFNYYLARHA